MALNLPSGDPFYYTEQYKTIIRSCKDILLSQAEWIPFDDTVKAWAYRGNFNKLIRALTLTSRGMSEDLIWTIAFINDIENPNQDLSGLEGIFIVNKGVIGNLTQVTRVIRE